MRWWLAFAALAAVAAAADDNSAGSGSGSSVDAEYAARFGGSGSAPGLQQPQDTGLPMPSMKVSAGGQDWHLPVADPNQLTAGAAAAAGSGLGVPHGAQAPGFDPRQGMTPAAAAEMAPDHLAPANGDGVKMQDRPVPVPVDRPTPVPVQVDQAAAPFSIHPDYNALPIFQRPDPIIPRNMMPQPYISDYLGNPTYPYVGGAPNYSPVQNAGGAAAFPHLSGHVHPFASLLDGGSGSGSGSGSGPSFFGGNPTAPGIPPSASDFPSFSSASPSVLERLDNARNAERKADEMEAMVSNSQGGKMAPIKLPNGLSMMAPVGSLSAQGFQPSSSVPGALEKEGEGMVPPEVAKLAREERMAEQQPFGSGSMADMGPQIDDSRFRAAEQQIREQAERTRMAMQRATAEAAQRQQYAGSISNYVAQQQAALRNALHQQHMQREYLAQMHRRMAALDVDKRRVAAEYELARLNTHMSQVKAQEDVLRQAREHQTAIKNDLAQRIAAVRKSVTYATKTIKSLLSDQPERNATAREEAAEKAEERAEQLAERARKVQAEADRASVQAAKEFAAHMEAQSLANNGGIDESVLEQPPAQQAGQAAVPDAEQAGSGSEQAAEAEAGAEEAGSGSEPAAEAEAGSGSAF